MGELQNIQFQHVMFILVDGRLQGETGSSVPQLSSSRGQSKNVVESL